MTEPRCFFEDWPGAGRCSGPLVRAHLIPRQLLRREYGHGALLENGQWRPMQRNDDERTFVPMCGGLTGCSGHHGQLDVSRKLRIPLERLPVGFVEFCDEYGLDWFVARTYGAERRAA